MRRKRKEVWRDPDSKRVHTYCPWYQKEADVWSECLICWDKKYCFPYEEYESIVKRAKLP